MTDYHPSPSPSDVLRLIEDNGGDIAAKGLIDALVRSGNSEDQAVRLLRSMLDSGDIGLGPEMRICLLRQPA